MKQIRVKLSDVLTDVLVRLVDHAPEPLLDVVQGASPIGVDIEVAWEKVESALSTLAVMGLVEQRRADRPGGGRCWFATGEGRRMVVDARSPASVSGTTGKEPE